MVFPTYNNNQVGEILHSRYHLVQCLSIPKLIQSVYKIVLVLSGMFNIPNYSLSFAGHIILISNFIMCH